MNSINKKSIVFSLSILALSLFVTPGEVFATAGYVDNPKPYVASISPSSINANQGSDIIVEITGNGFIPSSIVRVNGSDRMTTFIDYSHLLVKLNSNDTYNTNKLYINVFNGFPGGGYSNAELFTINKTTPTINNTSNNYPTATKTTTTTGSNTYNKTNNIYSNTNQQDNTINSNNDDVKDTTEKDSSNLAASAIFGSTGSFFPSGLIQWILFAIIILLIVILARRVFGATAKYNEAPMKTP